MAPMRFAPPSDTEKGQIRIFADADALVSAFDAAYVRMNPGDYERQLRGGGYGTRMHRHGQHRPGRDWQADDQADSRDAKRLGHEQPHDGRRLCADRNPNRQFLSALADRHRKEAVHTYCGKDDGHRRDACAGSGRKSRARDCPVGQVFHGLDPADRLPGRYAMYGRLERRRDCGGFAR